MPTKKKASTTTTKKKPAAKKPAAKKPAAKKPAKKAAAKKPAKKAAAKKVVKKAAKKAAGKTAAKKVVKKTAKKTTARKVAKKAAGKVVKKAAKKTAAKKTAAKKPAKKAAAKKTAAKKTAAKKKTTTTTTTKTPAKKLDIASLASAYADPAAIPLPAKKASKAASKASAEADGEGHGAIALPAKKKALDVGAYGAKPSSKRAAVTVVPRAGDDDVDDALDDAMEDAFDAVFEKPKKLAKPTVPFVPGDPSLDLAQTCAALALEKKADNVVILQVAELTSYADYFVIAAAASERQAQAIARNISDELRRRGKHPLSTDGLEQGNWVIVDYGSVVVHVFMESARAYYDLDGFWVDAPRVEVDEVRGNGHLEHLGS